MKWEANTLELYMKPIHIYKPDINLVPYDLQPKGCSVECVSSRGSGDTVGFTQIRLMLRGYYCH